MLIRRRDLQAENAVCLFACIFPPFFPPCFFWGVGLGGRAEVEVSASVLLYSSDSYFSPYVMSSQFLTAPTESTNTSGLLLRHMDPLQNVEFVTNAMKLPSQRTCMHVCCRN